MEGIVLSLLRESAGMVTTGTPLLEVGDPAGLEVAVDLLSFEAVKIQPDIPVSLRGWGGDELEGVVRRVEKIETAVEPRFQEHFVQAMAIPHAADPFPNLRSAVQLPEASVSATAQRGAGRRRSRRPA